MYKVVSKSTIFFDKHGTPTMSVLTLKDEYGGTAHIAVDDSCYVLYLENSSTKNSANMSHWWFPEAVAALKTLPDHPKKPYHALDNYE